MKISVILINADVMECTVIITLLNTETALLSVHHQPTQQQCTHKRKATHGRRTFLLLQRLLDAHASIRSACLLITVHAIRYACTAVATPAVTMDSPSVTMVPDITEDTETTVVVITVAEVTVAAVAVAVEAAVDVATAATTAVAADAAMCTV